jgi:hypothetical protein
LVSPLAWARCVTTRRAASRRRPRVLLGISRSRWPGHLPYTHNWPVPLLTTPSTSLTLREQTAFHVPPAAASIVATYLRAAAARSGPRHSLGCAALPATLQHIIELPRASPSALEPGTWHPAETAPEAEVSFLAKYGSTVIQWPTTVVLKYDRTVVQSYSRTAIVVVSERLPAPGRREKRSPIGLYWY